MNTPPSLEPRPCPWNCGAELVLKFDSHVFHKASDWCPMSMRTVSLDDWNRRPHDEAVVSMNPGTCYVCGAPAFCAVNVAPGAASGGTMKPVCDKHNPFAHPAQPDAPAGIGWIACSERMPRLAEYVLIERIFSDGTTRVEEANWQGSFGWCESRGQSQWVSPDCVKRWRPMPLAAAPSAGERK